MSVLKSFNYLIIITASNLSDLGVCADFQLQLLNVIFRHGDRTPGQFGEAVYPKDPYLNHSFPTGFKQLTNIGKMRGYKLGQHLRTVYNEFLGELYEPSAVYARSTDYNRTKMTLQVVLAGMYPPRGDQHWHPHLNWQPIATVCVRPKMDLLLRPHLCPFVKKEERRVSKLPEVRARISEYNDFMKNLTEFTGKNITTPEDMYNLYNTLSSEWSMGLILPSWTNGIFPNGRLLQGAILHYQILNYSPLQKQLNGGQLLREFLKNILQSVNDSADKRKVCLYSGHEKNVGSLLFTLRIYEPHVPQYTSAVIVELLKNEGEYYVRILYYKGVPAESTVMVIPGCGVLCPLVKFIDLVKYDIPSDENVRKCSKKYY